MKVELINSSRMRVKLLQRLAYRAVIVPVGFESDLATIPRPLWPILPPFGRYARAAVIHDYIYTNMRELMTRKAADGIFKAVMIDDGADIITRNILYCAVRSVGWFYWR